MSQFDTKIVYIKGGDNTVANALSHLPVEISASSEAPIKTARSPYEFCPDDDNDDSITVNAGPVRSGFLTPKGVNRRPKPVQINAQIRWTATEPNRTGLRAGYKTDTWCKKLRNAAQGMPIMQEKENLLFIGEHLVIPASGNIWESLLQLDEMVSGFASGAGLQITTASETLTFSI
ncbi:hypothetical protein L208DRAFT_1231027 [Tricholoma matsutake]|nr:hypothetical protein L208DRAFT_1231027 [Tricholoma matsutake 945]